MFRSQQNRRDVKTKPLEIPQGFSELTSAEQVIVDGGGAGCITGLLSILSGLGSICSDLGNCYQGFAKAAGGIAGGLVTAILYPLGFIQGGISSGVRVGPTCTVSGVNTGGNCN